MFLVDTSVWIDHLRHGDPLLAGLLREDAVLIHSLIIEEIACGHLVNRKEILSLFEALPRSPEIEHGEILYFLAHHHLAGRGIGVADAHLLASARLAGTGLWSRDKNLSFIAHDLGLEAPDKS